MAGLTWADYHACGIESAHNGYDTGLLPGSSLIIFRRFLVPADAESAG